METMCKVYFNIADVKLSRYGDVTNINDCAIIAEYEWDSANETEKFIHRMNGEYRHFGEELPMDISVEKMETELESLDDLFDSVDDAVEAFNEYLEEYKYWKTIYGGYYEPDEYVCTGLIAR